MTETTTSEVGQVLLADRRRRELEGQVARLEHREISHQRMIERLGRVLEGVRAVGTPESERLALALAGFHESAPAGKEAPSLEVVLVELLRHGDTGPYRHHGVSRVRGAVLSAAALVAIVALALVVTGGAAVHSANLPMPVLAQLAGVPKALPAIAATARARVEGPIGADAAWAETARTLDGTWERDWPRTIALLDDFLARWPGYTVAEDKLYAALVSSGEALVADGQVHDGVAQLERAYTLRPDQGQVVVALGQIADSLAAEPAAAADE